MHRDNRSRTRCGVDPVRASNDLLPQDPRANRGRFPSLLVAHGRDLALLGSVQRMMSPEEGYIFSFSLEDH